VCHGCFGREPATEHQDGVPFELTNLYCPLNEIVVKLSELTDLEKYFTWGSPDFPPFRHTTPVVFTWRQVFAANSVAP
jgi:hypothetical protein